MPERGTSLPLMFQWLELGHMTMLNLRESGKCSPAVALREGHLFLLIPKPPFQVTILVSLITKANLYLVLT